jgi:hypothetical protein
MKKKKAGDLHRTATTTYPCCLPALGRFSRSWSCKTCRMQIYEEDKSLWENVKVKS